MPKNWTVDQVLSLSPDAGSTKAGQDLASPRKWVTLGHNDCAAWGECQGSGKNPYQTQIDLSEPAFKCSCPSRKFPCKHALGLFLLLAKEPKLLNQDNPPEWVTQWLESRNKRAEQRAEKAKVESAPDPAAQAKRAASREAKVNAGLQELERWLQDIVRVGLASVQTQGYSFWQGMAARMVDAQAPGVARMLRDMAGIANSGEGWQERLLAGMSRLYLLSEGYKRIASLPEAVQADIRALIGWTIPQEELLLSEGVRDNWFVAGQRVYEEEKLRVQKTWLYGLSSQKSALILSFAHQSQPVFDTNLIPGMSLDANLVYFPSAYPLRALVKERHSEPQASTPEFGFADISSALTAYSDALAVNPWIEDFSVALRSVVTLQRQQQWLVRDESGSVLPLTPTFGRMLNLHSICGGRPVALFGEWGGEHLLPLSVIAENRFYTLTGSGE